MITFAAANPVNIGTVVTIQCPPFVGAGAYHWTLYRSDDSSGSDRSSILDAGGGTVGFSAQRQLTEADMYHFLIVEVDARSNQHEKQSLSEAYYCGNEFG